ncbi:MAG: hypothetical protein M3167_02435 [Acidobacteriota bacterium]|nr:hypothetical protein [Acidobacteriota bacterium]
MTPEGGPRVWRIVFGVVLLLLSIGGLVGPKPPVTGGTAGAIGSTVGLGISLALGAWGIWLIRTGMKARTPR